MAQVAMLLSNAFRPDPRVAREAAALTRAGHQVTVLCWDRETQLAALGPYAWRHDAARLVALYQELEHDLGNRPRSS